MSKLISIGKIIDSAWEHYITHFKELMSISAWMSVIALTTVIGVILTPADAAATFLAGHISIMAAIGGLIKFFSASIVAPIVGAWVFLNLIQAVQIESQTKVVDRKMVARRSWKLFLAYGWVAILKFVAVMLPILLIAPGVIVLIVNTIGPQIPWLSAGGILLTFLGVIAAFLGVIWMAITYHFAAYRLVFERLQDVGSANSPLAKSKGHMLARLVVVLKLGWQSMGDARRLVHGRFFATFWRVIIPKIVFVVMIVLIQIALTVFAAVLLPSAASSAEVFLKAQQITDAFISIGIAILSTPILILTDYYVYDSLRKNQ